MYIWLIITLPCDYYLTTIFFFDCNNNKKSFWLPHTQRICVWNKRLNKFINKFSCTSSLNTVCIYTYFPSYSSYFIYLHIFVIISRYNEWKGSGFFVGRKRTEKNHIYRSILSFSFCTKKNSLTEIKQKWLIHVVEQYLFMAP